MKHHQFLIALKQILLLPLMMLVFGSASNAQKLADFPLKWGIVNSFNKEIPSSAILKEILPNNQKGFTLVKIISKPDNPFSVFQLCYQNNPLHNFLVCKFELQQSKQTHYMVPDVSLENLPNPKQPCTLVYNGSFWEALNSASLITPSSAETVFYDREGEIRFREDWLLRFSDTVRVRGRVFRPDPVSRLQIPYGGMLRDRGDSSSALLRQAMDSVSVLVTLANDSLRLQNAFLQMGEFSLPISRKAVAASADSFWFDRDDPRFEELNAFYHLSSFRQFMKTIGFDSLARFQVKVDAHGMDGADQSAYSPLQGIIAYGNGNVDDAEDAAVIIHEYGHVLCHAALPFGNSGQERRSIEEGICDYLAGSYLRSLSNFQPDRIFRWDGNNEFWAGRGLLSSANYPNDLNGSFYEDGGIFCSALIRLEESIGREVMHKILFTAFTGLGPNITMPAAARLLLLSDSAIFQGQHSMQIRQRFLERGIDPILLVVSGREKVQAKNELVFDENFTPFLLVRTPEPVVELVDIRGILIRELSFKSTGLQEIPSRKLPPGMYFLKAGNQIFRLPVHAPR